MNYLFKTLRNIALRSSLCIKRFENIKLPQQNVPKRCCSNQKQTETPSLSPYSPEQCEKILNLLNTLNIDDLRSYNITAARANKLIAWKSRNGSIRSIHDILSVESFGLNAVDKFYKSLLELPEDKEELKKSAQSRLGAFLIPALSAQQRDLINSCVSLQIGVSSVSWARLELSRPGHNAPCKLTHWQNYEIIGRKMHLNDLIQRCLYIDHLIPIADCYILENPQMVQASTNPGSVEKQNISIQKSQITAILSYALAKRDKIINENAFTDVEGQTKTINGLNVYYIRRLLTARLFKHLIGTERVSSEESILKMMRTHYNIPEEQDSIIEDGELQSSETMINGNSEIQTISSNICLRGHVQFNMEQRDMYARLERYRREFLGQALLLNLAFIRLAILEDSESIAIVSRQSSKESKKVNESLSK